MLGKTRFQPAGSAGKFLWKATGASAVPCSDVHMGRGYGCRGVHWRSPTTEISAWQSPIIPLKSASARLRKRNSRTKKTPVSVRRAKQPRPLRSPLPLNRLLTAAKPAGAAERRQRLPIAPDARALSTVACAVGTLLAPPLKYLYGAKRNAPLAPAPTKTRNLPRPTAALRTRCPTRRRAPPKSAWPTGSLLHGCRPGSSRTRR